MSFITSSAKLQSKKPDTTGKTKLFEIIFNFEEIRKAKGTRISEKIKFLAQNTKHPFKALIYFELASTSELIESLNSDGDLFNCMSESAKNCTYVYWGCGSCGDDGSAWPPAIVEAYCDSGYYAWCEVC